MTQIVVAVPACNEAETIAMHLAALDRAAASTVAKVAAVIFANGCRDETAAIARAAAPVHFELRVEEAELAPAEASAGMARRRAMAVARRSFPAADVFVTSDADSTLAPDCLDAFRRDLAAGADLVCGKISFDLPPGLRDAPNMRRHDRVAEPYAALMRELRFGIDRLCGRQPPGPVPHYTASGACMALTRGFLDRIGGLPGVACGEDRALVRRAEAAGATIRYAPDARAIVSPRLVGRAAGGMADTLRRRLGAADPVCDAAFLSAAEARAAWDEARAAIRENRMPVLPERHTPMTVTALETEIGRLDAFLSAVVRPVIAAPATAPASAAPLVA